MSATKETVRIYMQQRSKSRQPLPSQEEIRRQLGWYLKEPKSKEK